MQIQAIIETAIYVDDLDATERFYHDILGLHVIAKEAGRHVFFQAGPSSVLLAFIADATLKGDHLPSHGAKGQAISPWASKLMLWTPGVSICEPTALPSKKRCDGLSAASPYISVIRQGIRRNW